MGGRHFYTSPPITDENLTDLNTLNGLVKDFTHAKIWFDREKLPFGCVGVIIKYLLHNGIDISLSPIVLSSTSLLSR